MTYAQLGMCHIRWSKRSSYIALIKHAFQGLFIFTLIMRWSHYTISFLSDREHRFISKRATKAHTDTHRTYTQLLMRPFLFRTIITFKHTQLLTMSESYSNSLFSAKGLVFSHDRFLYVPFCPKFSPWFKVGIGPLNKGESHIYVRQFDQSCAAFAYVTSRRQ